MADRKTYTGKQMTQRYVQGDIMTYINDIMAT